MFLAGTDGGSITGDRDLGDVPCLAADAEVEVDGTEAKRVKVDTSKGPSRSDRDDAAFAAKRPGLFVQAIKQAAVPGTWVKQV